MVPGIVPMGPHRYEPGNAPGSWDVRWLQRTCYPDASGWPPHELWSEDRLCPATNEFAVNTIAEAAAAYGVLCVDRK